MVRPLRGESGQRGELRRAANGEHDRVVGDIALVAPKLFAFKLDAEPKMIGAHLVDGDLANHFGRGRWLIHVAALCAP